MLLIKTAGIAPCNSVSFGKRYPRHPHSSPKPKNTSSIKGKINKPLMYKFLCCSRLTLPKLSVAKILVEKLNRDGLNIKNNTCPASRVNRIPYHAKKIYAYPFLPRRCIQRLLLPSFVRRLVKSMHAAGKSIAIIAPLPFVRFAKSAFINSYENVTAKVRAQKIHTLLRVRVLSITHIPFSELCH